MRGTAGAASGVGSAGATTRDVVLVLAAVVVVMVTEVFAVSVMLTPPTMSSVPTDDESAVVTAATTVATAELGVGLVALPAVPGAGAVGLGVGALLKKRLIEGCFIFGGSVLVWVRTRNVTLWRCGRRRS